MNRGELANYLILIEEAKSFSFAASGLLIDQVLENGKVLEGLAVNRKY